MTVFHYIPLVGCIFNFALSLFVLGCDRRSRLNQIFFAWGLGIATWNLGTYAMFQVETEEAAYAWATFLQYGVIVLPPTLLHLTFLISGVPVGKWIGWLYALHVGLWVMNSTGLFISGVRDVGYAYYSIAGPGFWIYALSLTQTFISVAVLWRKRQSLPVRQRGRFNGILAAQALIVIFGTNDILPIIGIYHYPIIDMRVLPYGSLAAAAYGVMVAYSVFQHQLLDVHLALGRSAAHIVRFAFLVVIGLVLELFVATLAPAGAITTFGLISTIVVLVVASFIASLLFPKLLGGAAEELERRLLGDRFEYQDQIRSFIEQSRWQTDLPSLLRKLHTLLVNTLKVRAYSVILLDETNRAFSLRQAFPETPERPLAQFSSDSPVFRFFRETKREYLVLSPDLRRTEALALEISAREQLSAFEGDIAFPLVAEDQPVGVLIIGKKANTDPFTRTDSQLLISLAENLSLVIHQIWLKNQLLLNQELDLLGRMSRGMAHDLNNLTTPVWTMLQLIGEGVPTDTLRQELVPVAIRNIQTMRAYIREALFFSENLRPDFQLGRLDVLIRTVVDLARENRRKNSPIEFNVVTPDEALVEMDSVLIQRLLTNIISNAVDASPEGGEVRVELIRLVKTDPARDWFRVRIADQGTGIRAEDLDRIFQPYFTTKKTGDENRGFGLGLAICRKIAGMHGGNLTVQSELGRGTTFNLDLPNRQKAGITPALTQPLVTSTPQTASS